MPGETVGKTEDDHLPTVFTAPHCDGDISTHTHGTVSNLWQAESLDSVSGGECTAVLKKVTHGLTRENLW